VASKSQSQEMKELVCIFVVSLESAIGEKTVLKRELKDINDSQDNLDVSGERDISSSSSSSSESSSNSENNEQNEATEKIVPMRRNQGAPQRRANESENEAGLQMSEYRSKNLCMKGY